MYHGFKTYRHFLNCKLHALSAVICGDDTLLDENLTLAGVKSVTELELNDARKLYYAFTKLAKESSGRTNEMKAAIGLGMMTHNQRAMIIKISRYNWNWTDEAIFSFIAEMFPDYRKRLSLWEIENSKLNKLFGLLSAKDADKIIKRFLQIEKRNSTGKQEQQ